MVIRKDKSSKVKPSVLVVDDNNLNRLLLQSILKKAHLSVDLAQNGKEACHFLEKNHYDILFLDHNMPILNGADVARFIIKEIPQDLRPITIAISGLGMDLEIKPYKELGIKDFILKPITLEKVLNILEKYVPKFILPQYRNSNKLKLKSVDYNFILVDEMIANYLGDKNLIMKLANSFLSNYSDCINKLEYLTNEGDWEKINFYTHSLFNSFSQMCFQNIKILLDLDKAALNREKDLVVKNIELLKKDVSGFLEETKTLVNLS